MPETGEEKLRGASQVEVQNDKQQKLEGFHADVVAQCKCRGVSNLCRAFFVRKTANRLFGPETESDNSICRIEELR